MFYTSGQFQIHKDEEFSILIDADGGDSDSALVLVTSNGNIQSQQRGWSDEFSVECLLNNSAFERPAKNCNSR